MEFSGTFQQCCFKFLEQCIIKGPHLRKTPLGFSRLCSFQAQSTKPESATRGFDPSGCLLLRGEYFQTKVESPNSTRDSKLCEFIRPESAALSAVCNRLAGASNRVCYRLDVQAQAFTETCCHTGTQAHRHTGTQAHRHTGTQAHRHKDTRQPCPDISLPQALFST